MVILARSSRPFRFPVSQDTAVAREVATYDQIRHDYTPSIPGVLVRPDGVWCGRDTVEIVGRLLGSPVSQATIAEQHNVTVADWPGIAEYEQRFAEKLWAHQPTGAAFLAGRSAAFECDGPRTGKNTEVLASCALVGAKRVLIATHGTPKLGWAEDVAKWFGVSALVLEGRKGTDAWLFCVPCMGLGYIANRRCDACRGRGWTYPKTDIRESLQTHRFVVANYDIFIGHTERDLAGKVHDRKDLPGWTMKLIRVMKPDTVVADEIQKVGGKGFRKAALKAIVKETDRVWAPTATPTDGRIVKLYSPFDIVTGGMFGRSKNRFVARYSSGIASRYSYAYATPSNGGITSAYSSELRERLGHFMIQRPDSVINPHLPAIRRQVVRVEAPKSEDIIIASRSSESVESALNATAVIKVPIVAQAAIEALEQGQKIVVYSRERNTGTAIYDIVHKALLSRGHGSEMRLRNTELWNAVGKSVDSKVNMANAFSKHEGAAMFAATIAGFQTGRSLLGVNCNFYADLHWDADAIYQTERRSMVYERRTGLVSVFFTLQNSPDDDVISALLPKLETLVHVFGDANADAYHEMLSPKETLDDIFARHAARQEGRK